MLLNRTEKLLIHKHLGIPIFFVVLAVMFFTTFMLGAYPAEWIGSFFNWVEIHLSAIIYNQLLKEFICDGVLPGIGLVMSFLPNIVLIFFFIYLMEMSGYIHRISYLMDNFMQKIGLSGYSIVILMMGLGCNVPAILAAKSIKSIPERIKTILITPFMSCSGRLPVYILITGLLFNKIQGTIVFISIYILGILLAMLFALIFKNKKPSVNNNTYNDLTTLPPLNLPKLSKILSKLYFEASDFLKKIFSVLLIASIILWFLEAFPRNLDKKPEIENSYIGMFGKKIEPVLEPLDFD